jgi:hypothetical protein
MSSQLFLTFVVVRLRMVSSDNPSRATKVATGFELRIPLYENRLRQMIASISRLRAAI